MNVISSRIRYNTAGNANLINSVNSMILIISQNLTYGCQQINVASQPRVRRYFVQDKLGRYASSFGAMCI